MTNVSVLIGTQMHCLIYWAELWEKSLWLQHVDLFHDAGVRVELRKKRQQIPSYQNGFTLSSVCVLSEACVLMVLFIFQLWLCRMAYISTVGKVVFSEAKMLRANFSVVKFSGVTKINCQDTEWKKATTNNLLYKPKAPTDLEDVFKLQVLSDQQPETQNM